MSIINYQLLLPLYGRAEALAIAQWIAEEPAGSYDPDDVLARLLRQEPLQYIFGHTDWRGLRLQLSPATLIPRPETSDLVDAALSLFPASSPVRVLDIGTGSGCIAIALSKARPAWQVSACDISPEALSLAQTNAAANQASVHCFPLDILSPDAASLPAFDLIVSNPPYICESEQSSMDANVLQYEPHSALFVPDADPLLFYRAIARLHRAPVLAFEINERFGPLTASMLRAEGYPNVQILQDICGKERVVIARQ